jgi:predicted PurR-regulated permease PerM
VFLAITGVLVLALLLAVRAVLLPFVLALVLAYVLTPLVAFGETRLRLPRAAAILLVYAVTLGGMYGAAAAISPRLYDETIKFTRDAPKMMRDAAGKYGPQLDAWIDAYVGRKTPVQAPHANKEEPAFSIAEQPDGSLAVELQAGLDLVQDSPTRWRISPKEELPPEGMHLSNVVNDALDRVVRYLKLNAFEVLKLGKTIVSNVSRAIFLTFMTLMVAGYIMLTRESILGFFRSLLPQGSRFGFERLLYRMDRGLAGVVRGQLLICVVNGVLSAIGFWIFDLKYWPILAILAGVMSLIPIFGSILSTIPAVAVGLTQDFLTALWVLIWIIGIHQLEANLLNPKIIGLSAKIHPVMVVFVLLVGEHFFGLWGALLAVPAWSITQSIFNHYRFEHLPDSGPDSLSAEELARRTRSGLAPSE